MAEEARAEEAEAEEAAADRPKAEEPQDTGLFTKCPRCGMTVRKTELSIHLAHAHNIDADRKPGGRGGRKGRPRDRG